MAINRVKKGKTVDYTAIELDLSDYKFYRLSRHLPKSIKYLLKLVDKPQQMQRFINDFGGSIIKFPFKFDSDDNFLKEVFSTANIQVLIVAFAGTELYIPKCKAIKLHMRDKLIVDEINNWRGLGVSVRVAVTKVRQKYSLSERRLRQILQKNKG